jgi:hypothetical protein
LTEAKPTPGSLLYVVDENGLMVSTTHGLVSLPQMKNKIKKLIRFQMQQPIFDTNLKIILTPKRR